MRDVTRPTCHDATRPGAMRYSPTRHGWLKVAAPTSLTTASSSVTPRTLGMHDGSARRTRATAATLSAVLSQCNHSLHLDSTPRSRATLTTHLHPRYMRPPGCCGRQPLRICIYMFRLQVSKVRGCPPDGMGLTMEGRGHTLRHVGNSFMSGHHEARCMERAATMQETSYNTHHASSLSSTGRSGLLIVCYHARVRA